MLCIIKDLGLWRLTGWICDLFNLSLLLALTADTKRQKSPRAGHSKLKAMTTHSVGGASLNIAELKIHDCTYSSYMVTIIEYIFGALGALWLDDHGCVLEQHPSLIFSPLAHAMFMNMPWYAVIMRIYFHSHSMQVGHCTQAQVIEKTYILNHFLNNAMMVPIINTG